MKTALITGVTGQDGSYLAEYLLSLNYLVIGTMRRSSSFNTWRIDHLYENPNFSTVYGDVTDSSNISRLIQEYEPDEIYNLAAQSHVAVSFEVPEYTADVDGVGVTKILEAIRGMSKRKNIQFYQASTSELFGGFNDHGMQSERTPLRPQSPYAAAKLYAYWMVRNYREAYGLHLTNGILFNHESPRRGETFVTRKITKHVSNLSKSQHSAPLRLGNLDAIRDWGYAKEYVTSMHEMLQQKQGDDYVVGTGIGTSVREFVALSFKCAGKEINWQGEKQDERGICVETGQELVVVDRQYFRPLEVEYLICDPRVTFEKLNWRPKVNVSELAYIMVSQEPSVNSNT
ncbi:GDP-mannose 4,6-dehydratase [Octadecabacter sp.]|nr:GDP-mannose 4,6-dehydratase [Octadecabacter sp.]